MNDIKFTHKLYNLHNPNSKNIEERLAFLTEELKAVRQKITPFKENISSPLPPRGKQELQELNKEEEIILKEIEKIEMEKKIKGITE